MSMFGNQSWWQGLQGLYGGGGGAPNIQGQGSRIEPPRSAPHQSTISTVGSTFGFDPFGGSATYTPQYFAHPSTQGGQGGFMPTYGQALAGGALADFQRGEQARQQELGMYGGLLGNIMGSMQGAGQMVQDARRAGQQGMQMAQQQAGRMREAAAGGDEYFNMARGQMERALGETRRRFDQSIGTLQQSKRDYDFGRRDDTAANVMGIQQQYRNQIDAITRRDDLTDEQKSMMTDELKQGMRQQSSSMAAQADARARDTMLNLDQSIAQMQASAAQGIGQMGFGVGQSIGQLGMQSAAMRQQAEESITNFYNNMFQYNNSMLQGAQSAALQYVLNGNQAMASIINAAPFGPTSIFGTLAHMIRSVDEQRGSAVSPQMSQMFGRIA